MVDMNKLYTFFVVIFCSFLAAEDCNLVEPRVYFVSPDDGYISKSQNVKLVFGIDNFNILPATGLGLCNQHATRFSGDTIVVGNPPGRTEIDSILLHRKILS